MRAVGDGSGQRELVVGVGAASGALPGTTLVLPLGPAHPSAHGALRLRLVVEGEGPDAVVRQADPEVGHLHRGAEKLFEHRDYRQAIMLADRHDWHCAFANETVLALAVEGLLGMVLPERALWLRTVLAELTRPLPALLFLGTFPGADATETAERLRAATALREVLQGLLEQVSGGRMHPMITRVGGLHEDAPAGWTDAVRAGVAAVRAGLPAVAAAAAEAAQPLRGVGVLAAELVEPYGLSGAVARASGAPLDLRTADPYLGYADLDVPSTTSTAGDVPARLACLAADAEAALGLVEQALDRLARTPRGPVNQRLPKVLRLPEGDRYAWVEAPLGISGVHVVSTGEPRPWRVKLRTPSYATAQVLPVVLPGVTLAELTGVLASLFLVIGDIDK